MVLEEERRQQGIDSMILEAVTGPPEQVAPCIRNALERNWEQALPGSLAAFQQQRKEEIERVCSRYYAEFLGSVQELLTAKSRSAALRQQIVRFTDELKRTGQETLDKGVELQGHKAARRNINAAVAVLMQCRELTSLMATAKQQIEDARYYPALRTLDSIAHQLSVAYEQPFVARVQRWLPELANQIKAAALRDVAHWLVAIRTKTTAIGKGAMRKCVSYMTGQGASGGGFAASYGEGGAGAVSKGPVSGAVAPTPAMLLLQQVQAVVNYTAWMEEGVLLAALPAFLRAGADADDAYNAALNALPETLDPVHRALHIHAHLGALDEVAQFYVNNRLPQATLPTGASSSSSGVTGGDEWVAQFQDRLAYHCGFFVAEHLALRATEHPEGLLPLANLEETWGAIQRDLCRQLEAGAATLTDPLHFIQLKQTALLVAFTLGEDCFRFNTQPLIDAVRGLRICYHQAQLRALEARCSQLLELDAHQQCQVQSEREYRRLVLPYALDRPTQDSSEALMNDAFDADLLSLSFGGARGGGRGGGRGGYPKTFAFSSLVPKLAMELHRVVVLCLLFSLQLQLPAMEGTLLQLVEDSLKALNRLLNKELARGSDEHGAATFPISKAVQISVDAVTLARMTTEFVKVLQHAAARFYSTEAACRLVPDIVQNKGKREFENTAIAAQHLVFELIQRKIDELLGGMCFIEWEAASPQSRPSPYVDDVVSYLQVTFMCLTHLPKTAREGIHFASCTHINAAMLELLCDPRRVKGVNTNGLHNLSVDLAALEAFADTCGVLQLRECFAELRQTLGTLLHRDVHALLLDGNLRGGVYPKAGTGNLVAILEKYKPLGLFAQVKNQQQGAVMGSGGAPVDLPYLDKKRVQEYLRALRHQVG